KVPSITRRRVRVFRCTTTRLGFHDSRTRAGRYTGSMPPSSELAARVEVALPVPVDSLFSYGVPAALAHSARPGCRPLAPVGARSMTGLIVARHESIPATPALRPIARIVDPEPVVAPELIRVLIEAAADAFCPVGLALACATPSGSAPREAAGFAATPRGREAFARGAVAAELRALLAWLVESPPSRASIEPRLPPPPTPPRAPGRRRPVARR